MAEDFKRLERTLVRKGKIIDYYQDTVQVPNGNVVKWDFIGHKGAAAMLAVREDGKAFMGGQGKNREDRYYLALRAAQQEIPPVWHEFGVQEDRFCAEELSAFGAPMLCAEDLRRLYQAIHAR